MDLTLILALGSLCVLIIFGIIIFLKAKPAKDSEDELPRNQRGEDAQRRVQMVRNQRARLRNNAAARQARQELIEEILPGEGTSENADEKIGAKKRAKLEAKAEKKAIREVEERLRVEKRKREQLEEEERVKKQQLEEVEAKRKEEEEKRLKEEQERKDYEEYLKMKEAFSVEEEGYDENEENTTLTEFINYIKENKVIVIEDLAAHFKLKTQAAIDRIQDLQKDNTLSGVIDDRGKFIYVSQEELDAVVKFIKVRGRVSITELAESSNQLINLNPSKILVS